MFTYLPTIPNTTFHHHWDWFCIKMGSDESHFNVSVGSDGQSHKTVSTNHNLFEEKGEPKRYRTEVLPLTSLTPYRWAKPAHFFSDYHHGPIWVHDYHTPRRPESEVPLGDLASSSSRWCLMSSGVGWHIRGKLRPVREHGSVSLYVHGNQKAR